MSSIFIYDRIQHQPLDGLDMFFREGIAGEPFVERFAKEASFYSEKDKDFYLMSGYYKFLSYKMMSLGKLLTPHDYIEDIRFMDFFYKDKENKIGCQQLVLVYCKDSSCEHENNWNDFGIRRPLNLFVICHDKIDFFEQSGYKAREFDFDSPLKEVSILEGQVAKKPKKELYISDEKWIALVNKELKKIGGGVFNLASNILIDAILYNKDNSFTIQFLMQENDCKFLCIESQSNLVDNLSRLLKVKITVSFKLCVLTKKQIDLLPSFKIKLSQGEENAVETD